MKLLLCDGDSWTAGDIVDPNLFGDNLAEVHHPNNNQYRLPRVWPHKLGKLLNVDVLNQSIAGSSNDGIVRRVLVRVNKLLKEYNSEDLFVLIGWSSPERRDWFIDNQWKTMYPAQIHQEFDVQAIGKKSEDLAQFYKTYLTHFWEKSEYIERYLQQTLLLHYYLKNKNIKHMFFDAFYEKKIVKKSKWFESKGESEFTAGGMYCDDEIQEVFSKGVIYDEFNLVRDSIFKKKSFRKFLMIDKEHFDDNLWDGFHPNEKGHELWAKELYKDINDKINNI